MQANRRRRVAIQISPRDHSAVVILHSLTSLFVVNFGRLVVGLISTSVQPRRTGGGETLLPWTMGVGITATLPEIVLPEQMAVVRRDAHQAAFRSSSTYAATVDHGRMIDE